MNFEPDNIIRIIDFCIEGKETGYRDLFFEYHAFGKIICLRHCSNNEDAEEILNDTFIKVFKSLNTFDKTKSFKAWFRKILINSCIDFYRRKSKLVFESSDNLNYYPDITEKIDAIDEWSVDDILKEIQKLSPASRTVFLLHAVEGYSHKEIAEMLKINEITSRTNYHKARAKLQVILLNKKS